MKERRRVHVEGGAYWVAQMSAYETTLFDTSEDYLTFERLLAPALQRTHTRALAYCFLPAAIHLVLQAARTPLGRVLQGFMSRYARHVHARRGGRGHLFADRYQSVLIDPDEWLAPVIRYLHYLPVLNHQAQRLGEYPHTSYAAYSGHRRQPWLDISAGMRVLARGEVDPLALLSQPPTADEVRALQCAFKEGVLGGESFRRALPRTGRAPRPKSSVDDIITAIAVLIGVERAELSSKARRRELALARALVAWHATERNIATLTEVAHRLRRDPSTLSSAMTRYRAARPELFDLSILRHTRSLG